MDNFFKLLLFAGVATSVVYIVKTGKKHDATKYDQNYAAKNSPKTVDQSSQTAPIPQGSNKGKIIMFDPILPEKLQSQPSQLPPFKEQPLQPQALQPLQISFIDIIPVLQQSSLQSWKVEMNPKYFGSDKNIEWQNVRNEEALNCGYHCIKNCKIALFGLDANIDIAKDQSIMEQFNNLEQFITQLNCDVPKIFDKRKKNIDYELRKKNIPIPKNLEEYNAVLKENRKQVGIYLENDINSNDGHIKTSFLGAGEVELLLKNEINAAIQKNTIVIDCDLRILKEMNFIDFLNENLSLQNKEKINAFKKSADGKLAVIWTESAFGHWVARVYCKQNSQLIVYRINSLMGAEPKNDTLITNFLADSHSFLSI